MRTLNFALKSQAIAEKTAKVFFFWGGAFCRTQYTLAHAKHGSCTETAHRQLHNRNSSGASDILGHQNTGHIQHYADLMW